MGGLIIQSLAKDVLDAIGGFLAKFWPYVAGALGVVAALAVIFALWERSEALKTAKTAADLQHALDDQKAQVLALEDQARRDTEARATLAAELDQAKKKERIRYVATTNLIEENRAWADQPLPPGVAASLRQASGGETDPGASAGRSDSGLSKDAHSAGN